MPVRNDIYGIGIKIHTPDGWEHMTASEIRMRLVGPITAAIGDLLIAANNYDEEAIDTAERLYRAAKDCGIDVSSYDEQMKEAVAKFHDMSDLDGGHPHGEI